MRWFKNRAGFSLIEITVAIALIGGLSLMVSELINWQSKSVKSFSTVIDRNELHDKIRAIISNPNSCPNFFGAAQGSANPLFPDLTLSQPISTLWDPGGSSRKFMEANKVFTGQSMKVLEITVEPQINSAPIPAGTGRKKYRENLVINLIKTSSGTTHNVGGDILKPITIPLMMTINDAKHVTECSFDSSGGAGANDCDAGFTKIVDTLGNITCQRVLCGAGKFPAGTNANGDVHCCTMGEHLAGSYNGDPLCWGPGKFMRPNGACDIPERTACDGANGEYATNISETTVTCCKNTYAEDPSGGSDESARLSCAPGSYLATVAAGCWNNDKFQWLRFGGGNNNYNNSGPVTQATARCASKGVKIYATCCHSVAPTFFTATSDPCPDPHFTKDPQTGVCTFVPSTCHSMDPTKYSYIPNESCVDKQACIGSHGVLRDGDGSCTPCEAPDIFVPGPPANCKVCPHGDC